MNHLLLQRLSGESWGTLWQWVGRLVSPRALRELLYQQNVCSRTVFLLLLSIVCQIGLRAERQSARMSKITNDGLTQSGTGCFTAVTYKWRHSTPWVTLASITSSHVKVKVKQCFRLYHVGECHYDFFQMVCVVFSTMIWYVSSDYSQNAPTVG